MSDEPAESSAGKAVVEPMTTLVSSDELVSIGPDHVLQTIVDLVNISTLEFGITLAMTGFLISGTLVSGRTFFDGMSMEMASAFTELETANAMKRYFQNFGNIYDEPAKNEDRRLPIFVHLREARFFHHSGKAIPGNRGVWWRGRLSQVGGFNMGTLSLVEK